MQRLQSRRKPGLLQAFQALPLKRGKVAMRAMPGMRRARRHLSRARRCPGTPCPMGPSEAAPSWRPEPSRAPAVSAPAGDGGGGPARPRKRLAPPATPRRRGWRLRASTRPPKAAKHSPPRRRGWPHRLARERTGKPERGKGFSKKGAKIPPPALATHRARLTRAVTALVQFAHCALSEHGRRAGRDGVTKRRAAGPSPPRPEC